MRNLLRTKVIQWQRHITKQQPIPPSHQWHIGIGVKRDWWLAKRSYDLAGDMGGKLPVMLSLTKLYVRRYVSLSMFFLSIPFHLFPTLLHSDQKYQVSRGAEADPQLVQRHRIRRFRPRIKPI
jgi:hypothetical protein